MTQESESAAIPPSILDRVGLHRATGLILILAGLGVAPIVVALSPDGQLAPATVLMLDYLRVFWVGLGLAAFLWPALDAPRSRVLLVILLLALALAARAVRLDAPYLDHHAHRQTDVATIARNFYEKDANILWPQVNWRADAPNYIESQFPLVPWLAAWGYRLFGEQPWVGRGIVALFAGLQVLALFGLVRLYWGQAAGFLAALFLALSPMAVYFGRTLMDDTPSLALATAALWGIAAWSRRDDRRGLTVGMIALALAVMVKLITLYVYLPVVLILWLRWRWGALRRALAWAIVILPLIPVITWYAWARTLGQHYLTFGIWGPASNEAPGLVKWGSAALVLSREFVARIASHILNEVLTPAGVIALLSAAAVALVGVAHLARSRKQCIAQLDGLMVFSAWLLATIVLVAVSGRAQWFHDYYQLPFATVLAPFIGWGLAALWQRRGLWRWSALGMMCLLAFFSARQLPVYHMDWHGWILREAEVVQAITRPDERIVTVTFDNQPTLLYHLHRPGWIVDYLQPDKLAEVPRFIDAGARLVILQNIETPQAVAIHLTEQPWLDGLAVVERTDRYVIYQVFVD